jgi:hypothetical protein
MLLGRVELATGSSEIVSPLVETAGSPHWHPAIHCITYRQNVAGLWLKYGVKSRKIEHFCASENSAPDATIC